MSVKISKEEQKKRLEQSMRDKLLASQARAALAAASVKHPGGKKVVVAGKGDYNLKTIGGVPIGQAMGSAAGSVFGDVGRAVGGFLGGAAHKALKWLTGIGSYGVGGYKGHAARFKEKVVMPAMQAGSGLLVGGHLPEFGGNSEEVTIIREECIGSIFSSVAFTTQSYTVNPGRSLTFPWLTPMAMSFGNYRIHGMCFYAKSFVAESSAANQVLGEWGMTTRYSKDERVAQSFQEFSIGEYSQTDKATRPVVAIVECDPRQNAGTPWKVVKPDGSTVTDEDHCILDVATQGYQSAGLRVGELWVSYKISFNKPRLSLTAGTRSSTFSTGSQTNPSANAASFYFANGTMPVSGSTLGGVFGNTNWLSLPKIPGSYYLVAIQQSSVSLPQQIQLAPGPDITPLSLLPKLPYSGGLSQQWAITMLTGATAVTICTFSYTAATVGIAQDIQIQSCAMPANSYNNLTVYLFPREANFGPLSFSQLGTDSGLLDTLRKLGIEIPGQPSAARLELTRSATVVEEIVDDEGNLSLQQWPYYGPCPPVSSGDVSRRASIPGDQAVLVQSPNNADTLDPSASSVGRPAGGAVRDPSPEELRAAQPAALALLRSYGLLGTNGSA